MTNLVGLAVVLGSVLILVECLAQLLWRLWPPVKAADEAEIETKPLVVRPLVVEAICSHDWLIERETANFPYKNKHYFPRDKFKTEAFAAGFPPDFHVGSLPCYHSDACYDSPRVPLDKHYQDAVCRKCDKTDLSFTLELLPMLKARNDRDAKLLESLRKTREEIVSEKPSL